MKIQCSICGQKVDEEWMDVHGCKGSVEERLDKLERRLNQLEKNETHKKKRHTAQS